MDVVTQSLLREFAASQKIDALPQSEQFEAFVNYVVVSDVFPEEFDFASIATGTGEFGLDGLAIIVNDTIVEEEEQLDDLLEHHSTLQVQFIFTQAKTSASFDSGDMSKFFQAVTDFFRSELTFKQNDRIHEMQRIKNKLYVHAAKFLRGLPRLTMFYATTGTWADDQNLCAIRDGFLGQLRNTHMFDSVSFTPLDASRVQKLYFQTRNSYKATIRFPQNLPLPVIPKVRESYIGIISASEYIKMITDDEGNVRRKLFVDNIRDYQGDTPVNLAIAETLKSGERIEFPLRNNGITIVTRKLQRVGPEFQIEDFQIVNGCQTSHVIAQNAGVENSDTQIPIKLIATEDEDVTRQIIIASNQSNRLDQDSFWALDPIHKRIEIYFESKPDDQRLLYERRPGQFTTMPGIEKVRIITKDSLLKNYASVFIEQPNQVGRYYKDLTPMIGDEIFGPSHEVHSYYTAAYIAYRLEFMFRNRRLSNDLKPFRFPIAMAARLLIQKDRKLDPAKMRTQGYCKVIDDIMVDPDAAQTLFERCIEKIHEAVGALKHVDAAMDRRTAKMRDLRDSLRKVIADDAQAEAGLGPSVSLFAPLTPAPAKG